jgi:hypothetical protein
MFYNISEFDNNGESFLHLEGEIICLEPVYYRQARKNSQLVSSEKQWQTYLNTLALLGLENWLKRQGLELDNNLNYLSTDNPPSTSIFPIEVGELTIYLTVAENYTEQLAKVSLNSYDLAIIIELWEDEQKASIRGFLDQEKLVYVRRFKGLKRNLLTNELYLSIQEINPNTQHLLYSLQMGKLSIKSLPDRLGNLLIQQHNNLAIMLAEWTKPQILSMVMRSSNPIFDEAFINWDKQGLVIPKDTLQSERSIRIKNLSLKLLSLFWKLSSPASDKWSLVVLVADQNGYFLAEGLTLKITRTQQVISHKMVEHLGIKYLHYYGEANLGETFLVSLILESDELLVGVLTYPEEFQ